MNWFYIWVPFIIVLHGISCKLSVSNQHGSNTAGMWLWIIGALPIWVIISRYSKNILVDAMLYDTLLVITYTIGIAYFGDKVLTPMNYAGIALMFAGLLMVKL